jgi:hypothetical protein
MDTDTGRGIDVDKKVDMYTYIDMADTDMCRDMEAGKDMNMDNLKRHTVYEVNSSSNRTGVVARGPLHVRGCVIKEKIFFGLNRRKVPKSAFSYRSAVLRPGRLKTVTPCHPSQPVL